MLILDIRPPVRPASHKTGGHGSTTGVLCKKNFPCGLFHFKESKQDMQLLYSNFLLLGDLLCKEYSRF